MNHNSIKPYRFPGKSSLCFLMLLFVTQANAIMIEALPGSADVFIGDTFQIDLVISGLEQHPFDEVIRAFHLDLAYDATIANATSVVFGDYLSLNHPLTPFFQKSDLSAPGTVMMEEVSLWTDMDFLRAQQPDSFILASIEFDAIGAGEGPFSFLPYLNFGIDIKGHDAQVLPVTVQDGLVHVSPAKIPEPSILLLFGTGLLLMALTRKK